MRSRRRASFRKLAAKAVLISSLRIFCRARLRSTVSSGCSNPRISAFFAKNKRRRPAQYMQRLLAQTLHVRTYGYHSSHFMSHLPERPHITPGCFGPLSPRGWIAGLESPPAITSGRLSLLGSKTAQEGLAGDFVLGTINRAWQVCEGHTRKNQNEQTSPVRIPKADVRRDICIGRFGQLRKFVAWLYISNVLGVDDPIPNG